ncbi:MAG: hypothetical protein IK954_05085 [Clostridia bacterium]|nr:hypothetical protein [Clostridia bacterium]
MQYQKLFDLFERKAININETSFYFKDDPQKIVRYIGCLPQDELPYWVGYSDAVGGCDFQNATELFETPLFDGKSLKDRWNEVEILAIGGIDIGEWNEDFCR